MSGLQAKKREAGSDALSRWSPLGTLRLPLPSPLEVREKFAGGVGGGQLGRLVVRSSRRAQEHIASKRRCSKQPVAYCFWQGFFFCWCWKRILLLFDIGPSALTNLYFPNLKANNTCLTTQNFKHIITTLTFECIGLEIKMQYGCFRIYAYMLTHVTWICN